jgi:alkanesulfonate monooxygenase SsuD/methylene tetrahydromethanopterin reductase-like flavin-dependent oxidoreductase (luciferase family)
MKYGLWFFPTDFTIRSDDLASAAETHGFDSLLVAEHTHIPTSRLSVPATGMRDLPPHYSHTLDPFVALATAASATKMLKLGIGGCLVIERDPIITAKAVASLDLRSGGRFNFGVGAGWNVEEMANDGTESAMPSGLRLKPNAWQFGHTAGTREVGISGQIDVSVRPTAIPIDTSANL